jgi:hypothetical protein
VNDRIALIAEAIDAYVKANPEAADGIEGIASWWLSYEHYRQTEEEVQEALDYLAAKGVVTVIELTGGRLLYTGKESRRR